MEPQELHPNVDTNVDAARLEARATLNRQDLEHHTC
jgi:hypothetical protein